MSIIRELHTRLSQLTWRETAKADEWSRPVTPIVGVGFMEEIRTCGRLRLFGAAYRALPHAPDSTKTAQRFSFCSPAAHTLHTGGKIFQDERTPSFLC